MSSDVAATAAREHAPTEVTPDAHLGVEPASGGSPFAGGATRPGVEPASGSGSPFAGGATRLAAVRSTQVMALQRLAGNAAVARLVAGRRPSVQREDPPLQHAVQAGQKQEEWLPVMAEGRDPLMLVSLSADLFKQTDAIVVSDKTWSGDPKVFKPVNGQLYFDDYIVLVDRTGTPLSVSPQTAPPTNTTASSVVIQEMATAKTWVLFTSDQKILAIPWDRKGIEPVEGVARGLSQMRFYVPGVKVGAATAELLKKRIPSLNATGTPGQPPGWAKDQLSRLKQRRGKAAGGGPPPGGPGGIDGGKGLGNEDKGGTGGGGKDDEENAVPGGDGRPKKEGGQPGGQTNKPGMGTGASATPAPNAKAAPGERKPGGEPGGRPLQGDPTFKVTTDADGTTRLQITIDRATTTIELKEGDTDGALDGKIDKALQKLQESRDPALHGKVAKAATDTAFTKPGKGQAGTVGTGAQAAEQARGSLGAATPGERIPGLKSGANAPAYPARITMGGNRDEAPVTVNGATDAFTMEIDYAAMSLGTADEIFNRMQTIQFYWELLDVTGKTLQEQQAIGKTAKVGSGAAIGAGSGGGQGFDRVVDNVAEDQEKDLAMMERQNWSWEARAAYLTVIGISNSVRMVGSLISSFVDIVAEPMNERSIGFDHLGEFLIRCVATPQPSDKALADPDHHVIRASSVAAIPVKVMDINARANQAISEEDKQLALLEAGLNEAKDDKERKEASLKLEAAKKATAQAGQAAFKSSVGGIRGQLVTARLLKTHIDKHVPDKELSAEEIYLEIALERRQITVEDMIAQLEKQLSTMAGKGGEKGEGQGEHEKWVAEQGGTFKGGVEYRPRIVLASEETGQVTPVLAMLGEATTSTDKHPRWRLIDISSPSSREIYEGDSATEGAAGHSAAIRDAFRDFAETNEYGRGTIAIRLPAQLLAEPAFAGATVEPRMRSAKGGKGRFLQRLQDLATVAEVVGLFVTGPVGIAVGAAGGVAGAVIAVDSLAKRARTGHVWEVSTIFDVLSVIGGAAGGLGAGVAVGRARLDQLAAAGKKTPAWVSKLEKTERALHIHGVIGNYAQIIVIPAQLLLDLNEIEGVGPQVDAQRALAVLRAIRSGAVTVIGAGGGIQLGQGKGSKAPTEPGPTGRRPLPAGHGADAADAHAGGSGPAKPPTRSPVDATGGGGPKPPTGGDAGGDVRAPTADQIVARARELARQRAQASADAVGGADPVGPKPATSGEPVGPKPDAAADPVVPKSAAGGTEPGAPKPAKPAETGEPGGTKPAAPHADAATGTEPIGPDVARRDALVGIVGKGGTAPDTAMQEVRPGATKNGAAADPDAVAAVKDAGQFGQIRRDVESMDNLSDGQRSALKSRLQEARLGVTNEQVGKVLGEQQQQPQYRDLDFHVQDLGTVGFNSDRDITIRVTPKDGAAYAKLSESEQASMDRRMILASTEAVPELYKALDAAGYPADRSLDTNFYTELHEGRVRPSGAQEATQIAADQQIVSMTEIVLNTSPEQWKAFVEQQRGMIDGLRAQKTPEADIASLRKRLDAQVTEAENHASRLVGEGGHPTADRRNAALTKAREALAEALKRQPPPTARETRQLMADVKLLEPDAFGTRAAVEGVVLGGQAMTSATLEKVRKDGFRTRRAIEHGEGEPGPRRLDPASGELREVSAEDEVSRRRAEAAPNVGHRRPGDANLSAYEANVNRLSRAQGVIAHFLGHLPEPSAARPTDTSTAAKNLGRIVTAASEAGITAGSDGLQHLPKIVAAKGAADSIGAIHKELARWAREGGVRGWAESKGYPLRTDAERVAAFIGWSKEQAMNLAGRLRIRTETGAVHGDIAVGTGRSTPRATGSTDAGSAAITKPMPSGEPAVDVE